MKGGRKLILAGVSLVIIAAAYVVGPGITGLLAATGAGDDVLASGNAPEVGMVAAVIGETELSSSVISVENPIQECPATSRLRLELRNEGNSPAEVISVYGKGIKVVACDECEIDSLGPDESRTIVMEICKPAPDESHSLKFRAANAEERGIEL
jgi:hypothetical protein